MDFDPAISAQQALHRAEEHGELGEFQDDVLNAEETFSTDQGLEAKQAYETLQKFGERLPDAQRFQEFLIYITWQQVTEETIPRYFQKGLELCDQFLNKFGKDIADLESYQQVLAIRQSFQGGLGIEKETVTEHDEDAFQGGD